MDLVAGIFLIAHGLLHLGVWLAPAGEDAPFDPRHSWLVGEMRTLASALAVAACAAFVAAGALVLADQDPAGTAAVAGAVISLLLTALTFNRWLSAAVVIDVAILAIVAF